VNVVAIEVTAECRACGGAIPFEGIAESATCGGCQRAIATPLRLWAVVLRRASEEGGAAPLHDERAATVATEVGSFRVLYRRTEAACGACGGALPIDSFDEAAGRGSEFCGACGARVIVRRAPDEIAAARFVVGEAPARQGAPLESIVLPCSRCGAPLPVDGKTRTFSCSFCRATSTVPDAAWDKLHPRAKVRRFYLACDASAHAAHDAATWKTVVDAVADEEGNVYAVGTLEDGETGASLWSFDRELRVRWIKRGLVVKAGAHVTLFRARDCIGVWEHGARNISFVACADGQTAFEYPAANGAIPVHVEKCTALAADTDGSILALVEGEAWSGRPAHTVFVRFTPNGEMLEVWPGVAAARPEPGATIPRLSALGTAPTCVQGAPSLRAGADGVMNLFASEMLAIVLTAAGFHQTDKRVVARLRRDGAVNVLPILPVATTLGGDASSTLWILGEGALIRLTRDGRSVHHLRPIAQGGVVGSESVLAVEPRGAAILLGAGGTVRRFGPDGNVELVR
jgi:hypothetical protein